MALFTRFGDREIQELCTFFDLGHLVMLEGIVLGTINSNYRVATDRGTFFVRINEGKAPEEIAYEADLVEWLALRGVPAPCPRRAKDCNPFAKLAVGWVTVFPWIDGIPLSSRVLLPEEARQAGRALAAVHLAGTGFPKRRESRYCLERIRERWHRLRDVGDDTIKRAVDDAASELEWLEAKEPARAQLPCGVIHGDLFPDNVLFRDSSLSALLDFEQASDGTFAYDLAVCLCSWCFREDFAGDRLLALREGYESMRRLTSEERMLIWAEARAAALRFMITRITDVHLNPCVASSVRQEKDFRRFHARLLRLRELGELGFKRLLALS